jgi:D-alanyl-D-alanine carboxypeptidase
VYGGEIIGNHNHLLGRVDGVDGIKTGYTRASGFNLLTSVHRDGRSLIAAPAAKAGEPVEEGDNADDDETPTLKAGIAAGAAPAQTAPARPIVKASIVGPAAPDARTPAELGWKRGLEGPAGPKARQPGRPAIASASAPRQAAALTPRWRPARRLRPTRPQQTAAAAQAVEERAGARGSWIVQIGATENPAEASALLARARAHNRSTLAAAKPVTEKVRKGDAAFYRARFAGLDPASAETACRELKRDGFSCFAAPD